MPYVETSMIGSSQVVRGFAAPSIDPVATEAVVAPLLAAEQVCIDHATFKNELTQNLAEQAALWETWKAQTRFSPEWNQSQIDWNKLIATQAEIQTKCQNQDRLVQERRRTLIEEHAVRFEIGGVVQIDDATERSLKGKLEALAPGYKLLFDGSTLVDHVGEKYWTKTIDTWAETTIDELGVDVPPGSFKYFDLSTADRAEVDYQIDRDRIIALTPETRADERDQKLEEALAASAQKRGELEITGHEDPLGAAQDWYNAQVAEINTLYAEPV
jgi:hypothetical protein